MIAVQCGRLGGRSPDRVAKRTALVEVLRALYEDSRLTPPELVTVCGILFALLDPTLQSARKRRNREPHGHQ
ncbi:MAG TPA: hypothetical protein VJY33_12630 [Isosphaeraceae bacterium]|nr:hypothetical protein [Isosphaeraceae bacterium]